MSARLSARVDEAGRRRQGLTIDRGVLILRKIRRQFPLVLTGLLAIALFPLFKVLHLTGTIEWQDITLRYWVGTALESVAIAGVIYGVCFPQDSILPLLARYQKDPRRLFFLLPLAAFLLWLYNFRVFISCELVFVGLIAFELADLSREKRFDFVRAASRIFPPAAYLFVGLIVAFTYVSVITTRRFYASYDAAFDRMDRWILAGSSVPEISHTAVRLLPLWFFHFLESVYFMLFGIIGASLIIVALKAGRRRAMQLVGTLLTAYYIGIAIYYVWPSVGPFYLCQHHLSEFPNTLATYVAHKDSLEYLRWVWQQRQFTAVGPADCFVAFPSLHLAQTIVLSWFLREWKPIRVVLLSYISVLVLAIILLEWHYFVDLPGGAAVAFAAIALVDSGSGDVSGNG
jgi:hypothetical protein